MNAYEEVLVYSASTGDFMGRSIKKVGVDKLQSLNLWDERDRHDLEQQLQRLNDETGVLSNWPSAGDPEVLVLLEDPNFEPPPMETIQVPDMERSTLVQSGYDADRDEPIYDEEASDIVYKDVVIPQQAFVQQRTKKAQEIVARRRASV